MNRPLVLIAVCSLVATLGACSDGATPTAVSGDAAPAGVSAVVPEFPAVVETVHGQVTIEKQPARVVALGFGDADTALALGVSPVGVSDWGFFTVPGLGPWAVDQIEGEPEVIDQTGSEKQQYAQIKALKPDLILQTDLGGVEKDRYRRLARIAPVVAAPAGLGDVAEIGYDQQTMFIAKALGVPREGRRLLDELQARTEDAAASNPGFRDRTVASMTLSDSGYWAALEDSNPFQFYSALGFRQSPEVRDLAFEAFENGLAEYGSGAAPLAEEGLDELDADLLVLATDSGISPAQITEDPGFGELADRALVLDKERGRSTALALGRPSILSADWLLQEFVPQIAETLS